MLKIPAPLRTLILWIPLASLVGMLAGQRNPEDERAEGSGDFEHDDSLIW